MNQQHQYRRRSGPSRTSRARRRPYDNNNNQLYPQFNYATSNNHYNSNSMNGNNNQNMNSSSLCNYNDAITTTCLGPEPCFEVEDYCIVLLGHKQVGKTSLCYQFVCNRFVSDTFGATKGKATTTTNMLHQQTPPLPSPPNLCNTFRTQLRMDEGVCHLELVDTRGAIFDPENQAVREQVVRDADGFMVMFDVTCKHTFDTVDLIMRQLLSAKRYSNRCAIVLVANKSDMAEERQISQEQIEDFAREWNVPWIDLSAKLKKNVSEAFQCAVLNIRKSRPSEEYIIPQKKGGCEIL